MATLADELQNDFADSGSEGGDFDDQDKMDTSDTNSDKRSKLEPNGEYRDEDDKDSYEYWDRDPMDGLYSDEALLDEALIRGNIPSPKHMRSVPVFMKSLQSLLDNITYYEALPADERAKNTGADTVGHPEYKLVTDATNFSVSIDDHIIFVHKYIRDHYSVRFPELETLLVDPMEYTKAVAIIGNGPMGDLKELSTTAENLIGKPLNTILSRPKLMTITVEATTSKGGELPESEMQSILEACSMMLQFEKAKEILANFVQSGMELFAPNLTRMVGALTAARILSNRGGLIALANSSACNLPNMGAGYRLLASAGLAANAGVKGQGYIYQNYLVQNVRAELRPKAMRIVSGKLILAARVDSVHESPDGSVGEEMYNQVVKRLDELTKPGQYKGRHALAAPEDKPPRKRGGRRARMQKAARANTELQKSQNRMAFGKEEQEVGYGAGDETVGLGMIGQSNDGRIRAVQVDERTRAKLSKKNPGWGGATTTGGAASSLAGNATVAKVHGLKTSGIATAFGAAGTASSLAFTPKQGLELVDPKVRAAMERKNKADEDRWFKGGTFTQVGGGSSVVPAPAAPGKAGEGGFKVPMLPVKRKLENDG